jgi:hypothetical protein
MCLTQYDFMPILKVYLSGFYKFMQTCPYTLVTTSLGNSCWLSKDSPLFPNQFAEVVVLQLMPNL